MRPLGGGLQDAVGLVAGLIVLAVGYPACASAWNLPKGEGQAIVKYEAMRADEAFSPDGDRAALSHDRLDRALSVFVEYGLDDRLTLQMKGEWQEGRDAFVDFQGRGPLEIGVRWQAFRDARHVAALYLGYAHGGEGRNAGYAPPGAGDHDWEARVMAGRSLGVDGQGGFIEAQAARRWRAGLPDETRLDLTAGARVAPNWMLLAQAYAGAADEGGARWLSLETSAVRRVGDWSLQAGWRTAVAGRETPAGQGPVIGIWRRF